MKTIVVYDTKHGTTRKVAQKLAEAIGQEASTCDLSQGGRPDLSSFDTVVLGGPVYAGSWSRRATAFARANQAVLAGKRFAAFASGYAIDQGKAALQSALPPHLASAAVSLASLGGAYVFKQMGAFERFIVKLVSKSTADASSVDGAAIAGLARAVKGGAR